jgi:hypothetical protein
MKKKKSSRPKAARRGDKKAEGQQGTPDTQMERLKIADDSQADEDALLEEAIKLAAAEKESLDAAAAEQKEQDKKVAAKHVNECKHGFVANEDHCIISDFAITYITGYNSVGPEAILAERLIAAEKATAEKYPEVWGDPSKLKQVVSYFIFRGTRAVLDGNVNNARCYAAIACYFEEHNAVYLQKTKFTHDPTKPLELFSADEHTLVKYLRKNIPCKCLDKKYKEVKSITKMGVCFNPKCSIPDKRVERRKMLYCTRCCVVNYCSRECQEAAWPEHKELCNKIMAERKVDSNSPNKRGESK